ncbi:riboflavin synthase [Conexibacter sp. DBS9H8]|uniref:riboflavin synthase n=1 Tax=Conexibacter sp. DBS9H8 TaxID=2937801 RepID=UPI00200BF020|nr:riboflavin synthase [Conexibacter sp. DBS9H8]
MFTGLIEDRGEITAVARSRDGVVLSVATQLAGEIRPGDSVAANGVCLTAVNVSATGFDTEVMNETLSRSSLAEIAPGSTVNLELAMRPTDRLGGHIVQGHVDGTGEVLDVLEDGFSRRVLVAASPELLRYVVVKGSITVDGVSLTVAALDSATFTVSLIPETLARTNLGSAAAGRIVNLEVDIVAKYVERLATASLAHFPTPAA